MKGLVFTLSIPKYAVAKALDEAQGKWPDYPRLVVDLARKHKQPLVGWTLPTPPNQPQFWDRLRAAKGKAR